MSPNRRFPSPFPTLLERPNLPRLEGLALRERGAGWTHALRLHRLTSEITTVSRDRAFPEGSDEPALLDCWEDRGMGCAAS
jgi:hypothetical protein